MAQGKEHAEEASPPSPTRRSVVPCVRITRMPPPANPQLIELRYENICPDCGVKLPVGTQAYWSSEARGHAWCRLCVRLHPLEARVETLERQRDGERQ